ncbi:AzlD domain-containing protein [Paenibacillus gyeongsangnamensis]|uniref:AzlD domain-containing protein n=1 Tax=Paenibacillus gyeongsangnamensis TaxID=3388067 RepID=UPI003907FE88
MPEWAKRWLNYVPIAIMAALIGQELFIHHGRISLFSNNLELYAAIPSFLIAVWTRSLLGAVLSGVTALMVLRFLF